MAACICTGGCADGFVEARETLLSVGYAQAIRACDFTVCRAGNGTCQEHEAAWQALRAH